MESKVNKRLSLLALILAVSAFGNPTASAAAPEIPAQKLGIIPQPESVNLPGGTYALPKKIKIATYGSEDERNVAGFLIAFLKTRGISASIVPKNAGAAIHLLLEPQDNSIGSEGYHLAIADAGITISASKGAGLFYGLQTLEQLFPAEADASSVIPQVQITDKPEYPWRGFMLDVSRHYFPVSFVEQLIDVAAAYKLNTFHWHLVDDQGWRIEIKKYPRLTQIGSCGDYNHPLGTAPCQFYTQQEIKEVVDYAKQRHVRVIPEIELPGHSAAALAAYPELACKPITGDAYCPSEKTFQFLENVLDEVMKLFPDADIHTGGDEVSPAAWNASTVAQAAMQQNHLSNAGDLQRWFDQRIEAYLEQHGRRVIGWDEVVPAGVSKNVIVMSWRGTNGGILAAAHGNDVVMSPGKLLYFNTYQGPSAWEPLGTNRLTTLHDVYSYGPDLLDLSHEERSRILGPEGCLWAEFVPTPEVAWYRLFPRTLALAEMAWTTPEQKNWEGFQQRTSNQYPRLEARGIPFYIPGPFELKDTTIENDHAAITLTTPVPDAAMYYTQDGSYPTTSSQRYETPISISLNPGQEVHMRVVTVLANGRTSAPSEATYARRLQAGDKEK
jgi:hexosaminidase